MKVLLHFYNLQERAGIQRAICELANALAAQNNQIVLVSNSSISEVAFDLDARVLIEQIVNPEIRATGVSAWPLKIAWAFRQIRALRRSIFKHRPTVVIDHGTAVGLIYPFRSIAGVPFILQRHFPVFSFPRGKLLHRLLSVISGRKIIVVLSEEIAAEMRSVGMRNIVVIPNIVPAAARYSPFSQAVPRTALLMGRAKNLQKGFDLFLKALSIQRMEGWHFRIVGPGVDSDPMLVGLLLSNQLQDRVELLPACSDPYEMIRSSSCVIMPSRYEALPMVALEALSIGRPIIASDAAGLGGLVIHEVNGLVFPNGDVDALARCLTRVQKDNLLLERLAAFTSQTIFDYQVGPIIERWASLVNAVSG